VNKQGFHSSRYDPLTVAREKIIMSSTRSTVLEGRFVVSLCIVCCAVKKTLVDFGLRVADGQTLVVTDRRSKSTKMTFSNFKSSKNRQ